MAGIYIHIPFCKRKCHYCNFFSVVSGKYRIHFPDTLTEEVHLQHNYLGTDRIDSVYFGGGTPSLLDPVEINKLLSGIRNYYEFTLNPEITLEANPDDVSMGLLSAYRQAGINRLSIGIQSFFDDDLEYLNRIHSSGKAISSVSDAKNAGFDNITIDLIYGLPAMTDEKWRKNLEIAFSLDVQHISAYSLTVEPKTALDVLIRKKKVPAPDEETTIRHFRLLMKEMKKNGFIHYEISNFCREGYYSRHNSMYWNGEHYLGLGPSAHSFNGATRQWNVAGISEYIDRVKRNDRFFDTEILTKDQKYNEYVMTSLRTIWGSDLARIRNEYGGEMAARFLSLAVRYLESGQMTKRDDVYYLTDEGKLFADGIASDLFIT
jgi:oxygen-independent coproporphyrinogen III oxidase